MTDLPENLRLMADRISIADDLKKRIEVSLKFGEEPRPLPPNTITRERKKVNGGRHFFPKMDMQVPFGGEL